MKKTPIFGFLAAVSFAHPGWTQIPATSDLGFDSSQPIEVNADNFVANLENETASYRGHVVVRQGVVRLSADQITLFAPGGKAARMEASGNIVVATPSGSAVGEKGVYDVAAKTLHLTGDVTLTKDKNVIRGTALDVAMDTGQVTLAAGREANAAAPGAGESGGRVQGVFIPKQSAEKPPPKPANP